MEKNHYLYVLFIGAIGIFLVFGCTLFSGYGKLRQLNKQSDNVTIKYLEDTWNDYTIYYAGYYGALSVKHPSALVFDLKNDQNRLEGDKWTIVKDKETLLNIIDSIQRQESPEGLRAEIWKIFGPDNTFYGYFYSAWRHVVLKVINEKTMIMYDLPLPPYLVDDYGEERAIQGK